MHHGPAPRLFATSKLWLPALLLAPILLAGCACRDGAPDEWVWDAAFIAPDADDTDGPENPECRIEDLAQRSELSAALSARADPALLAAARRDAERACDRTIGPPRGYAEIK